MDPDPDGSALIRGNLRIKLIFFYFKKTIRKGGSDTADKAHSNENKRSESLEYYQ